jgi:hypothetical protein
MSIKKIINQLRVYKGSEKLKLHKGADEALFCIVENEYGVTLPDDFKELYRFSDGFETVKNIFNMIPLAEIINNKTHQSLYIAEYMIYSNMWLLEINPFDCNDYKIVVEANSNRIILTNSLAEFINCFLKGGVYDPGGLYDWQEEVELQPIYSTKLKTAELLLSFFYYGLSYNIILNNEVINWADRIVKHEDKPDIFFIELSVARDKNQLMSLLSSVCIAENTDVARPILGLLYHLLSTGVVNVGKVIEVMHNYNFSNLLTQFEIMEISVITNEVWMIDSTIHRHKLTQNLLEFLSYYKEFEVTNYKHWPGISRSIGYKFLKRKRRKAQTLNIGMEKLNFYLQKFIRYQ